MTSEHNIVITGFMGTGKSTIAPLVAERLDREWVDTDVTIERRTGLTISEMFARFGEDFFRDMERAMCAELCQKDGLVISTGGGTLIDPDNRQRMIDSGMVVCLNAPDAIIEQRLAGAQGRPLAAGWRDVLAQRRAIYAAIPYHIDTADKTPIMIAQEVISLWNAYQTASP